MKNVVLLLIAAFCSVAVSAQKVYFLYLQSDDQTPFYIRMGDKIHSSASAGFLILPNLTDSVYNFGLGFAKSSMPEAKFSVNINQNDKGYIIKNFEDGLALFNFEDMSVVKSNSAPKDNTVYETKKDNFSAILSKAADDPSLLKVPVAKKEEPGKEKAVEKESVTAKLEETKPADTKEANITSESPSETKKESDVKEPVIKEASAKLESSTTVANTDDSVTKVVPPAKMRVETTTASVGDPLNSPYRLSVISRHSESSTTEGFGLVYFDQKEGGIDTIRILIPASKVKLVSGTATNSENLAETEQAQPVREKKQDDAPVIVAKETKEVKINVESSSCKNTASDKDFIKLRKRMAGEESDDEMIDEARKEFRNKCFSVEQIKNLSSLFLTSAAKYQFFDAAYQHVSDKNNFATLQSEIRDEYYLKRFKALIGE